MKNKITFAIDCDEVLRALLNNMLSLYNKEFNDNLKYDDITDFVVENSFPKIKTETGMTASNWFFQEHSTELFLNSEALPKIKEAIEILKQYGDVIIVTYQKSYTNKKDTLEWLEKQNIIPDGICFLKDKTILHPTYFIDDNDWNFEGCNADYGVLIDAPYNKEITLSDLRLKSNCKNIFRYKTLYDFAVDSKEIIEYKNCF